MLIPISCSTTSHNFPLTVRLYLFMWQSLLFRYSRIGRRLGGGLLRRSHFWRSLLIALLWMRCLKTNFTVFNSVKSDMWKLISMVVILWIFTNNKHIHCTFIFEVITVKWKIMCVSPCSKGKNQGVLHNFIRYWIFIKFHSNPILNCSKKKKTPSIYKYSNISSDQVQKGQ